MLLCPIGRLHHPPPPSAPTNPVQVSEITFSEEDRILTPDKEFNRVLGGGIVAGSLVLIGGEPGIGKSTLMLQLALNMPNLKVLYISGEESERQIKMRAERLAPEANSTVWRWAVFSRQPFRIWKRVFYIDRNFHPKTYSKQIEQLQPDLVVVDSIQTLHSSHIESTPGSVSQVRECTAELLRFAKESSTPVIFNRPYHQGWHDCRSQNTGTYGWIPFLQFEGDRHHVYRILRCIKNRFGSASELGIYEMLGEGLREVSNPSEILVIAAR